MNPDELRRMLREADPAAGRELDPLERAAMRRRVVSADEARRKPRSLAAPLGVTLATAAVLLLVVLMVRRAPAIPAPIAAVPPAPPAPTVAEDRVSPRSTGPESIYGPVAIVAVDDRTSVPSRRGRLGVERAAMRPNTPLPAAEASPATRIVFTGPDGTRILWFVGEPTLKEVGS
jgi:hypothetical protein